MPRTEKANQQLRDVQHKRILDAARKVFARKGLAATMADIAAAADISQGLAYRYFASKEAIFSELVERTAQTGLTTLQRILGMPGTAWERLEYLVSMMFENNPVRLEYYQLSRRALDDDTIENELNHRLLEPGRAFQDILRQLIVEGQATGEVVAGDPDQLVMAVMACFDGLSRFSLRDNERFNAHFPDAVIILRMLKP